MTPDEARDLLDGTTPGPWILHPVPGHPGLRHITTGETMGLTNAPECIPVHMDSKVGAANMTAIATVPSMLATIAGMREEWGVKWDDDPNGPPDWGFATRAAAERWEKRHRHRGPGRGHIVRRYVTTPEEA